MKCKSISNRYVSISNSTTKFSCTVSSIIDKKKKNLRLGTWYQNNTVTSINEGGKGRVTAELCCMTQAFVKIQKIQEMPKSRTLSIEQCSNSDFPLRCSNCLTQIDISNLRHMVQ